MDEIIESSAAEEAAVQREQAEITVRNSPEFKQMDQAVRQAGRTLADLLASSPNMPVSDSAIRSCVQAVQDGIPGFGVPDDAVRAMLRQYLLEHLEELAAPAEKIEEAMNALVSQAT